MSENRQVGLKVLHVRVNPSIYTSPVGFNWRRIKAYLDVLLSMNKHNSMLKYEWRGHVLNPTGAGLSGPQRDAILSFLIIMSRYLRPEDRYGLLELQIIIQSN